MNTDRYYVLGQLVAAVTMLRESKTAYMLLPEIRSNPVMACEDAETTQDVAGIPGRLTEVFGTITAPAYPAWGASRYTALILLAVRKIRHSVRATMEIKYDPKIVKIIEDLGISIVRMDIEKGAALDAVLKNTMRDGVLADVFYTEGGFAREGAIIITDTEAVRVAETVIRTADLYAAEK
ncbi:MAG: hypothetical protein JXM72_09065 [Deltaproteobacteria bacterium]|nr:hypothetical protein [Deltaproteobacteria bacterium]